jgi:hypothetical protein
VDGAEVSKGKKKLDEHGERIKFQNKNYDQS